MSAVKGRSYREFEFHGNQCGNWAVEWRRYWMIDMDWKWEKWAVRAQPELGMSCEWPMWWLLSALTVIGSSPMQSTKTYEYSYVFCERVIFVVMDVYCIQILIFILCVGVVVVSVLTFRARERSRSQIMVIRWWCWSVLYWVEFGFEWWFLYSFSWRVQPCNTII